MRLEMDHRTAHKIPRPRLLSLCVRLLHRGNRATVLGASQRAMHLLCRTGRVDFLDVPDVRDSSAHLRRSRDGLRDS